MTTATDGALPPPDGSARAAPPRIPIGHADPLPPGDLSSHVFREVRTKRLVVVDEDGFERVVAGFLGAHVDLPEVSGKSDSPDGHHQIALIVKEAATDEGARMTWTAAKADIYVCARGENVVDVTSR